MEIRLEEKRDFEQVYALNAAAFGGEEESKLVQKLRNVKGHISLVAVEEDKILGHISFSPVTLNDQPTAFAGLAPMSVLPEKQKAGIGKRLVEAGLTECSARRFTGVFVLGHTEYYPKFGFRTAVELGFTCEFSVPPEYFMAIELERGAFDCKSGLIKYDPVFSDLTG